MVTGHKGGDLDNGDEYPYHHYCIVMADFPDGQPSDDNDFTKRFRAYQKALEEEWEESQPSENDTPEELAKKARKLVISSMPRLIEKANLLALGANSESVSLQAIRFLYQIVVPPKTMAPGEVDPMDALINKLTKEVASEKEGD